MYPSGNTKSSDVFTLFAGDVETGAAALFSLLVKNSIDCSKNIHVSQWQYEEQ
jgi:hypothetical protein